MSKTPEGKIKDTIKKQLDALDCWYFMPMMMGYGRKGIPDFIGCYRGKFFAIEAKAEGKSLTPWQSREASAILASGGIIRVVNNEASLASFLDAI